MEAFQDISRKEGFPDNTAVEFFGQILKGPAASGEFPAVNVQERQENGDAEEDDCKGSAQEDLGHAVSGKPTCPGDLNIAVTPGPGQACVGCARS
jgi:hypothetical protein